MLSPNSSIIYLGFLDMFSYQMSINININMNINVNANDITCPISRKPISLQKEKFEDFITSENGGHQLIAKIVRHDKDYFKSFAYRDQLRSKPI